MESQVAQQEKQAQQAQKQRLVQQQPQQNAAAIQQQQQQQQQFAPDMGSDDRRALHVAHGGTHWRQAVGQRTQARGQDVQQAWYGRTSGLKPDVKLETLRRFATEDFMVSPRINLGKYTGDGGRSA